MGVLLREKSGGDLLSQGVSAQVPSALEGLTSVFGMGTGVTPPREPPSLMLEESNRATLSQLNSGTDGKRAP